MGAECRCHPPLHAGSWAFCDLALRSILFTVWSHRLFMRLLKGKREKRSGHLLVTYSSSLLLWSMERTNKLGKVLCTQKIWNVCLGWGWGQHEGDWFKVSDRTKGPLAKSFFLSKMLIVSAPVLKGNAGEFLGGPVVKIQWFNCRGPEFDPWSGMAHMTQW